MSENKNSGKSRFKLFIENMLVYGLGGVISRIIPFIMVPLIAYLLPSKMYFGLADNANLILSFGSAIAVMGMYDAMYRYFFEKEDDKYKKTVCSTTVYFTLGMSLLVSLLIALFHNQLAQVAFKTTEYSYVVFIVAVATLVSATNGIISAPTRMQNKRKIFLVTNTLSPILSYAVSIPLILQGHYIIALPIGALISGITMEAAFLIMNRKWFDIRLFDTKLLKKLLIMAVPLLPNVLIYWVFNSSDRLMITNMIDLDASGLYSFSGKLGHASQLIYTAFAGGWQYFAFSTMKENDQVKNNSHIFEYLSAITFAATAFICVISKAFFELLFPQMYWEGYIVAPYLFLAPLLQMLFQVSGNQFLVVKKTWPLSVLLLTGAVLNIICNYELIPVIGIEGAAIGTLLGYLSTLLITVAVLVRMKLLVLTKRVVSAYLLMTLFFLLWRFVFKTNLLMGLVAFVVFGAVLLMLYHKELKNMLGMLRRRSK